MSKCHEFRSYAVLQLKAALKFACSVARSVAKTKDCQCDSDTTWKSR